MNLIGFYLRKIFSQGEFEQTRKCVFDSGGKILFLKRLPISKYLGKGMLRDAFLTKMERFAEIECPAFEEVMRVIRSGLQHIYVDLKG